MTKRNKTKYPNLNNHYNLKSRWEYIETEYINGVFDKQGNRLIRELTKEEKEWLDKFYRETVNANFTGNKEIYELTKRLSFVKKLASYPEKLMKLRKNNYNNKNDAKIEEIEKFLELHKYTKFGMMPPKSLDRVITNLNKKIINLKADLNFYSTKDDEKSIYEENNSRNRCIYNRRIRVDYDGADENSNLMTNDYPVSENYIDKLSRRLNVEPSEILKYQEDCKKVVMLVCKYFTPSNIEIASIKDINVIRINFVDYYKTLIVNRDNFDEKEFVALLEKTQKTYLNYIKKEKEALC